MNSGWLEGTADVTLVCVCVCMCVCVCVCVCEVRMRFDKIRGAIVYDKAKARTGRN